MEEYSVLSVSENSGCMIWIESKNLYKQNFMKLLNLLKILEQDYNHEWPNEDKLTKKHRLKVLEEIKKQIGVLGE